MFLHLCPSNMLLSTTNNLTCFSIFSQEVKHAHTYLNTHQFRAPSQRIPISSLCLFSMLSPIFSDCLCICLLFNKLQLSEGRDFVSFDLEIQNLAQPTTFWQLYIQWIWVSNLNNILQSARVRNLRAYLTILFGMSLLPLPKLKVQFLSVHVQ